jgi:uncharacterized protein (DUF608 family)
MEISKIQYKNIKKVLSIWMYLFFYFSNFHNESSKIIKYALKNYKIKKYTIKSKNH